VRIYGENLDQMRAEGDQVLAAMNGIKGIVDQHMDLSVNTPQIQVEVNLARAGAVGLKPGDVRRAAATMVAGLEEGNTFLDQKVYGVVAWSVPSARGSVTSIGDMLLDTPSGNKVRLGDIATVTTRTDPYLIT